MSSLIQDNQKSWGALERVAMIRVGALGDLLVGTAALAEMARLFPRARLTVIGPKFWPEIISPETHPEVERIVVIEKKAMVGQVFVPDGLGWRKLSERSHPLKQVLASCQGVVNFNIDSYRYGLAAFSARVKVRVGSAPAPMAWLYTHTSPFFGKDPLVHERDAALLLLEYSDATAVRFLRSVERNRRNLDEWVNRSSLVQRWRTLGLPSGKRPDLRRAREITGVEAGQYVLINPTSSRREKAWPATQFHQLIKRQSQALNAKGIRILVAGAPHETEWLREVAGDLVPVVQPPSILDLQDVLSGARGLLTNTSSVQFIAAMTGTPAVVLMGRGRPEIWGPLGPGDEVIHGTVREDLMADIFQQEADAYQSLDFAKVEAAFLRLVERKRLR